MIFETLLYCGSVTVISGFITSLVFGYKVIKLDDTDPNSSKKEIFNEKRKILERDRAEWIPSLRQASSIESKNRATNEIAKIDKKLLDLLDQELKSL